jgi:hypothetical protein
MSVSFEQRNNFFIKIKINKNGTIQFKNVIYKGISYAIKNIAIIINEFAYILIIPK